MGVISSLGVRCQVRVPDGISTTHTPAQEKAKVLGERGLNVLDLVDCVVEEVSMARNLVVVVPVRVVKGFERIGEWA